MNLLVLCAIIAYTSTAPVDAFIQSDLPMPPKPIITHSTTSELEMKNGGYMYDGKHKITAASSQSPSYHQQDSFQQRRQPVMAGNWKLNPSTLDEARNLLQRLSANFRTTAPDVEVIIFPPYPYLLAAVTDVEGTFIKIGAQNVGLQSSGAYTGEVSVSMLRSIGVDYVMLGHSERRTLFHESNEMINEKLHLCLSTDPGLNVILCVGETEDEYESNLLSSVVDVQVRKGLKGVSLNDLQRVVIAYEPVWSIGTGKTATPEQAQIAHEIIRQTIRDMYGNNNEIADKIRIQYGGSVKPENVQTLMAMPDVDGALVGGASLTADDFTSIIYGGVAA